MSSQARTALTDEELASRFQATSDPECFAQIFSRHRSLIFSACRRFFGGNSLAEDATQETFIRAYQAMSRFNEGNLCGWLLRIARNVCIDTWRKHRPESHDLELDALNLQQPLNLDHQTDLRRAMHKVQEEMKLLPADQRRCLELKMDGYSYEETAERTGFSVKAVKSHLQNGRRMLWLRVQEMLSQLP